jgi:hypothetical protein
MRTFTSREELKVAIKKYFDGTDNADDIGTWDTSQITDMSNLFECIKQITHEPIILNWNTINVKNMSSMFNYCDQDFILNFDTSNVTDMSYMFNYAINFNQPLFFDTSNVTNMCFMFDGATNYNHPLYFNIRNVNHMNCILDDTRIFNNTSYDDIIYLKISSKYNNRYFEKQLKYNYNKLLLYYILYNINDELTVLIECI